MSNQLGQYANTPGHRAYSYAEQPFSSLTVATTIASTHFAYPLRDDQAELAWVALFLSQADVYARLLCWCAEKGSISKHGRSTSNTTQLRECYRDSSDIASAAAVSNVTDTYEPAVVSRPHQP